MSYRSDGRAKSPICRLTAVIWRQQRVSGCLDGLWRGRGGRDMPAGRGCRPGRGLRLFHNTADRSWPKYCRSSVKATEGYTGRWCATPSVGQAMSTWAGHVPLSVVSADRAPSGMRPCRLVLPAQKGVETHLMPRSTAHRPQNRPTASVRRAAASGARRASSP